jgi:nucleoside 2-deoxyribosyltransferase
MRPRIYFARGVDGLPKSEVTRPAARARKLLAKYGLTLIDPVDSSRKLKAGEIVASDLHHLKECDAVLMDMTVAGRNYIGCCCELVYAYLWRKPVLVYVGTSGNEKRHWLRYHASKVCRTQAQAIAALVKLVQGGGKGMI